MVNYVNVYQIW